MRYHAIFPVPVRVRENLKDLLFSNFSALSLSSARPFHARHRKRPKNKLLRVIRSSLDGHILGVPRPLAPNRNKATKSFSPPPSPNGCMISEYLRLPASNTTQRHRRLSCSWEKA